MQEDLEIAPGVGQMSFPCLHGAYGLCGDASQSTTSNMRTITSGSGQFHEEKTQKVEEGDWRGVA